MSPWLMSQYIRNISWTEGQLLVDSKKSNKSGNNINCYNDNNESGGTSGGLETCHYNKEFQTTNTYLSFILIFEYK